MHCRPGRLIDHLPIISLAAAFAVGFTACSMHPLPDDVTRVSTFDIVQKIRCEAKEGLREAKHNHLILKNTAIGYDFTFEIDEDNNATKGALNFDRPGFRKDSNTSWDFTGSSSRKRRNKREFRIVERLEKLNAAECSEAATRANWIYPIAGAIGMDEVVRTYIKLEELTDFGKLDKAPTVFSEDLDFTTEFGGGVTPTLELATVAGKFKLSNATIFAEAKRKDIHSVTVALAQDGPVDVRARPPAMALEFVRPRVAAAVAERGADAKTRVLIELERRRIAKEDERLNTRLLEALRPPP